MTFATTFILIFARILALMVTAPIFGSRTVGLMPRIAIALAVSLLALAVTGAQSPLTDIESVTAAQKPQEVSTASAVNLAAALPAEIMTGALLGLGVMIIFSAAEMAGGVIGQMAGIQITGQISPGSSGPSSPVSSLFGIMSLAVFAMIGGPELLVTSVLDTFASVPPGSGIETSGLIGMLTGLLQQSFVLTLRGVGPAVVAMLISTLVIGLIGRSYPQINMLAVGLSSNMIVMFLAIFLTLGGCVWLFVDDFPQAIEFIRSAISTPNKTTTVPGQNG